MPNKAIFPIPSQLDDSWQSLRASIMGNPNSVINKTNDWVGWFMEGLNEAVWPRNPADAAAYGGMGLGPAVTTAIPKPFKSEWLERLKKYVPSFPKKATGQEILQQLESRGILPKGYGEYYLPPQMGADLPYGRDQLIPYMEENWVNPRIDVKSRSSKEFMLSPKVGLRQYEADLKRGLAAGSYTPEEVERYLGYARSDPAGWLNDVYKGQLNKNSPRYEGMQSIFNDQADDYFELLIKPRRGLEIPVPEKLATGGHWDDPSVMAHIRGETVGPRAIIQEVQGDWNRIALEKRRLSYDPIYVPPYQGLTMSYLDFLDKNRDALFNMGLVERVGNKIRPTAALRGAEPGYYAPAIDTRQRAFDFVEKFYGPNRLLTRLERARHILGNVPPLPPEFSKAWPEAGVKAALGYAARQPNLQRVSFVDDLIAASVRNLDPEKTAGIYGARLPQFLRKYVPKYGGEYRMESAKVYDNPLLRSDLAGERNMLDRVYEFGRLSPDAASLHTVELGDWNSPFRKFLRGQQPLAIVPGLAAIDEKNRNEKSQNKILDWIW